jgi:hypothetical protein
LGSVCVGGPYKYCRAHSPNEFTRIDLLNETTKCIGNIMERTVKWQSKREPILMLDCSGFEIPTDLILWI